MQREIHLDVLPPDDDYDDHDANYNDYVDHDDCHGAFDDDCDDDA